MLWEGQTSLIPKVAGTTDPAQHLPIGVSSLLVRVYHWILARRLDQFCLPSRRQKGFRPGDSLAENTMLLKEILKVATDSAKPSNLSLVFLDVKKAFDSVSHESIQLALRRDGIPPPLLNYFAGLYSTSWTRILSKGGLGNVVKPAQVVRQGDPLSSFIFNAVIDWTMEKMDRKISYKITGEVMSYFAFTDDLVVLARSRVGLSQQVSNIVASLHKSGLEVNPSKFASLSLVVDGKRKTWAVDAGSFLKINSVPVPALGVREAYRYLGLQFKAQGTKPELKSKLDEQLSNVSKAPLKPQQRIWILKSNVYPALLHQLVLADSSRKLLKELDICLRRSVRQWLRLPNDTPLAYFHANVRDGGLGILSLLYDMPGRIAQRAIWLQNSKDSMVAQIAMSPKFTERVTKWSEPVLLQGNAMNSGKALRRLGNRWQWHLKWPSLHRGR